MHRVQARHVRSRAVCAHAGAQRWIRFGKRANLRRPCHDHRRSLYGLTVTWYVAQADRAAAVLVPLGGLAVLCDVSEHRRYSAQRKREVSNDRVLDLDPTIHGGGLGEVRFGVDPFSMASLSRRWLLDQKVSGDPARPS
jgi:hypothetical protein